MREVEKHLVQTKLDIYNLSAPSRTVNVEGEKTPKKVVSLFRSFYYEQHLTRIRQLFIYKNGILTELWLNGEWELKTLRRITSYFRPPGLYAVLQ